MWFNLKYADISINFFLFVAYIGTLKPHKNGSWNSTRNNFTAAQSFSGSPKQKLWKFENSEITSSTKFITEGIHKAYFEHKFIT